MRNAMNINHEWNKLIMELNNNTCVVAALKYINPINTKRHKFCGNEIRVLNTSIDENCLHDCYNQANYIRAIH
jgi:hypothetical protein